MASRAGDIKQSTWCDIRNRPSIGGNPALHYFRWICDLGTRDRYDTSEVFDSYHSKRSIWMQFVWIPIFGKDGYLMRLDDISYGRPQGSPIDRLFNPEKWIHCRRPFHESVMRRNWTADVPEATTSDHIKQSVRGLPRRGNPSLHIFLKCVIQYNLCRYMPTIKTKPISRWRECNERLVEKMNASVATRQSII